MFKLRLRFKILLFVLAALAITSGCEKRSDGMPASGYAAKTQEAEAVPETDDAIMGDTGMTTPNDDTLPKEHLTAYFLDVGQGSCALFETGGHYLLIDGGDRETSSFVVAFLKEHGVEELDYCIATHFHSDHISGLVGCLSTFPTKCVIAPDYEKDSKTYISLMGKISAQGLHVTYPVPGDVYPFGEGNFTILSPNDSLYSDENDYSVGIRLEFGKNSFLIAGDATALSEYEMLENECILDSDVYAVNHHGSDTSSSEGFLSAVSPSYAIISCGKGNSYGHPAGQTMERLGEMSVSIYRTDVQGTIVAESDGKTISFETEPCKDYSSGDRWSRDASEAGAVQENPREEPQEDAGYVLNTSSHVFHLPGCESVQDMSEANKEAFFGARSDAEDMGYRACRRCMP